MQNRSNRRKYKKIIQKSDRYLWYCRKYNEETNESPWLGTEEPTPSDADGKEIMEDEDMQSLITKNKDDWFYEKWIKYLSFNYELTKFIHNLLIKFKFLKKMRIRFPFLMRKLWSRFVVAELFDG